MAFDPAAATAAYIDSLGPAELAKAAAYTTGNHWLLLWNLLVTALVTWLIVRWGLLEKVEARFAKRGQNLRAWLVAATYFLVSSLLTLPWALYSSYYRELAYGRTSQPLADFLGQGALAIVISAAITSSFFVGIYWLIRRAGRLWWLWSGALTAVVMALLLLASPVVIEPLFNQFKPVPAGAVRDAIVPMAQRAGVPTDRIFVYDGSRQSNNFTANCSGIGGSARIAIADVAFKGATLDEVTAVTAHEVGHYVLGHVWRMVFIISVLSVVAFFLADRLFPAFARALGSRARIGEPVGISVLILMVSVFGLLGQPLLSTLIRTGETEADQYSLETVNLPDGLSTALVKTAEYRNPRPGRLEEILFYDHPSVERRVRRAMDWKAAHPAN